MNWPRSENNARQPPKAGETSARNKAESSASRKAEQASPAEWQRREGKMMLIIAELQRKNVEYQAGLKTLSEQLDGQEALMAEVKKVQDGMKDFEAIGALIAKAMDLSFDNSKEHAKKIDAIQAGLLGSRKDIVAIMDVLLAVSQETLALEGKIDKVLKKDKAAATREKVIDRGMKDLTMEVKKISEMLGKEGRSSVTRKSRHNQKELVDESGGLGMSYKDAGGAMKVAAVPILAAEDIAALKNARQRSILEAGVLALVLCVWWKFCCTF